MTGIQLVREIKKIRPELPSILMTGCIENIDINRTQSDGIAGFVKKPLNYNEIADAIHEVLHAGV